MTNASRSGIFVAGAAAASLVWVVAQYWPFRVLTGPEARALDEQKAKLEQGLKAIEDMRAAQAEQEIVLKSLKDARAREIEALKAGDREKIKEAQEAAIRAEAEANRNAEAVKQREIAARKALDDARKAQEAAKRSAAERPAGSEKAADTNIRSPTGLSRAERERILDEATARKALAAAGKAPSNESHVLFEQAVAVENGGNVMEAIRIYRQAANAGSGKAAKRLGEIYDRGAPGVPRDYALSLQWYELARQLGETVELAGNRSEPGRASIEVEALYRQALALEGGGNAKDAIRIYRRAARAGNGKAAMRLGEIFNCGAPGVPADYAESLQWYEFARQQGEQVPRGTPRPGCPQ